MAAWKSSDGGSIAKVGGATYGGFPAVGSTTIVSAAENVRGLIIRTATIYAQAYYDEGRILAGPGSAIILGHRHTGAGGAAYKELPREIFAQSGSPLVLQNINGAPLYHITYDLL